MTTADLARLRSDTNAILESAPKSIGGPVNWGDLYCHQAREWNDDEGDTGLGIYITEASPDAAELQSYVRDALKTRGWENVEIWTDW